MLTGQFLRHNRQDALNDLVPIPNNEYLNGRIGIGGSRIRMLSRIAELRGNGGKRGHDRPFGRYEGSVEVESGRSTARRPDLAAHR